MCDYIKNDVFKYIETGDKLFNLILINGDEANFVHLKTEDDEEMNKEYNDGLSDPSKIGLYGFPTMLLISNGKILRTDIGVQEIMNSLESALN